MKQTIKRDDPADPRHDPWDIPIEQAVLGACLFDNKQIDVAAETLEPFHFYDPLHQRLFEFIRHLATEGAVTPIILHAVMKTDPGLIEVKGRDYLIGLTLAAPAMPNIKDYSRILIELANRRELIRIGEDMVTDAYKRPTDNPSHKIAAAVTDELLELGQVRRKSLTTLGEAAHGSIVRVEERIKGTGEPGVTTGLRRVDKVIGSILPGDRIGIPARTGMGKSLVSSSMLLSTAMAGAPNLIISADMRAQQWADRAICDMDRRLNPGEKPIYYQKFRTGSFSESEWERVVLAQQAIAALPISIDDNPRATVSAIRNRARAEAKKYPGQMGILAVDFLQKVEPAEDRYKERRRDEDLTAIAYALGDIVREIGWALVVLIQLKNKGEDGHGKLREDPPSVNDIRESGGIEMALDIIVSPFRKSFFIERREPPGRGFPEGPPPEWKVWQAEYSENKNRLQMLGWKNRDGRASALNLDLWCDPGSASVRDEEPRQALSQKDRDLLDLAGQ